jgi:hypothetical protein
VDSRYLSELELLGPGAGSHVQGEGENIVMLLLSEYSHRKLNLIFAGSSQS